MSKYGSGLAPEEWLQEAYKTLIKDKGRLAGTVYPVYKGPTVAPMSSLTQRARTLRDQFNRGPSPYSRKIETVLGRDGRGISDADVQGLLGTLSGQQRAFTQGPLLDPIRREFSAGYDAPRAARFTQKAEKDLGRFLPQATGSLGNISKISGNLEGSRNREIASVLQGLQRNKMAQREGLVSSLEKFGDQRHAHTNLVNGANRALFEDEASEPYRKMQSLEESLGPHRSLMGGDGGHPDVARLQGEDIARSLRAYGVDPSKPPGQWDSTRTASSRYPGQLVAGLPAEIQASGDFLERLNPSLRDAYTDKRKALTADLTGNPNLSAKALQNLNPAMQGFITQLEDQFRQRMKTDMAAINNRFIKLGQHGSPQHIAEAEERARTLNKAVLEERDRLLQSKLKEQLELQHSGEINNIKQLGQIGEQSHQEYGNLFKRIGDLNQLGATKFANNQDENEDLYKNYQNERLWEMPHMRSNIRRDTRSEIGDILRIKNISLDNLLNLNTRYSELNKMAPPMAAPIATVPQAIDELALQRQRAQAQQAAADAQRQQQIQVQQAAAEQQRQAAAAAAAAQQKQDAVKQAAKQYEDLRAITAKYDSYARYISPYSEKESSSNPAYAAKNRSGVDEYTKHRSELLAEMNRLSSIVNPRNYPTKFSPALGQHASGYGAMGTFGPGGLFP